MRDVLYLYTKPVHVEARRLKRSNIDELKEWIHAKEADYYEDLNGFHVIFEFENEDVIAVQEGSYICKDAKQHVFAATKAELDEDHTYVGENWNLVI